MCAHTSKFSVTSSKFAYICRESNFAAFLRLVYAKMRHKEVGNGTNGNYDSDVCT